MIYQYANNNDTKSLADGTCTDIGTLIGTILVVKYQYLTQHVVLFKVVAKNEMMRYIIIEVKNAP